MRKLFSILIILFVTFGIMLNDAEAGRFGGGRSFGMQRSITSRPMMQPASFNRAANPASKWLAPLAGLAAGGLLAYLFMGHGVGTGILSWLLLAGVGLMLWNAIRGKWQPATPQQRHANPYAHQFTANDSYQSSNNVVNFPSGFNADEFLREAKVKFIRLQAAYDAKNLQDIREFSSPEVFAEIQMQLQERGDAENHTEVVNLDAKLLEATPEVVSVHFSGLIRENPQDSTALFNEIWHFRKEETKQNWIVAGVQQE